MNKKSYINELISVQAPVKLTTGYQVPTYENINSITIMTRGELFVVFNTLNYRDSLTVDFNSEWTFKGELLEKLNAPIIFNIIVTNPLNTNNACYLWIKRYID